MIKSPRKKVADPAGDEPATSRSPVGRVSTESPRPAHHKMFKSLYIYSCMWTRVQNFIFHGDKEKTLHFHGDKEKTLHVL